MQVYVCTEYDELTETCSVAQYVNVDSLAEAFLASFVGDAEMLQLGLMGVIVMYVSGIGVGLILAAIRKLR